MTRQGVESSCDGLLVENLFSQVRHGARHVSRGPPRRGASTQLFGRLPCHTLGISHGGVSHRRRPGFAGTEVLMIIIFRSKGPGPDGRCRRPSNLPGSGGAIWLPLPFLGREKPIHTFPGAILKVLEGFSEGLQRRGRGGVLVNLYIQQSVDGARPRPASWLRLPCARPTTHHDGGLWTGDPIDR